MQLSLDFMYCSVNTSSDSVISEHESVHLQRRTFKTSHMQHNVHFHNWPKFTNAAGENGLPNPCVNKERINKVPRMYRYYKITEIT